MHGTEPSEIRVPRSSRRSLRLRLRVWTRRGELTRELAAGRDPDASDELALVAGELISARTQTRLADAIDAFLLTASAGGPPWERRRPPNRAEVLDAGDDLRAVIARLRAGGPLPVHAVARAAVLALDVRAPIYAPNATASVWRLARDARASLNDPIA